MEDPKASHIISELQKAIEKYGDLPVVFHSRYQQGMQFDVMDERVVPLREMKTHIHIWTGIIDG